jgi:hypothetical protein
MRTKLILIFLFFAFTNPVISQTDYEAGKWYKESKSDDFGDINGYKYGYLNYDKFNYNFIVVRVEKSGLGIYQSNDSGTLEYYKLSGPYIIKFKDNSGYMYSDESNMISSKGALVLNSYSKLYRQLTNGEGKTLSVVIYNGIGNRINSFNVSSFNPTF